MNDKEKLLKLIRGDDVPQVVYFHGIRLTDELLSDPEILDAYITCVVRHKILLGEIELMNEFELMR